MAPTAGFYANWLLGYHSTHERLFVAIVGWLLLEYFAYMCKCEALNDTQLFPIIHQWSGFSLGTRLSPCVVAVCMVSAGLEVVAAVCVITSPNCLHRSSGTNFSQDKIVPLYKMVLA